MKGKNFVQTHYWIGFAPFLKFKIFWHSVFFFGPPSPYSSPRCNGEREG